MSCMHVRDETADGSKGPVKTLERLAQSAVVIPAFSVLPLHKKLSAAMLALPWTVSGDIKDRLWKAGGMDEKVEQLPKIEVCSVIYLHVQSALKYAARVMNCDAACVSDLAFAVSHAMVDSQKHVLITEKSGYASLLNAAFGTFFHERPYWQERMNEPYVVVAQFMQDTELQTFTTGASTMSPVLHPGYSSLNKKVKKRFIDAIGVSVERAVRGVNQVKAEVIPSLIEYKSAPIEKVRVTPAAKEVVRMDFVEVKNPPKLPAWDVVYRNLWLISEKFDEKKVNGDVLARASGIREDELKQYASSAGLKAPYDCSPKNLRVLCDRFPAHPPLLRRYD